MWLLLAGAAWVIVISVILAVAPNALPVGGAVIIGTVIFALFAIPFVFWVIVLYRWVRSMFVHE